MTILLLALVLPACTGDGNEQKTKRGSGAKNRAATETAATRPRSGDVTFVEGRARLDTPYVVTNRVYRLPGSGGAEKLSTEINTTFLGTLSPAVVPEPRGGPLLVYNAFRRKRPVLRLHNTATDDDSVLAAGAVSAAWGSAGIAYFKALDERIENPRKLLGHVVVRESLDAEPRRWTRKPARYIAAAWAGDRLLVYRLRANRFPDLLVLDGPMRERVLAEESALVAVSPDGTRAFVSRYAASPVVVQILAITDAEETASFRFDDQQAENGVTFVAESGSWSDDLVFAPATFGVVVFRVEADEIAVEQMLRFDRKAFPIGVWEPQADKTGSRIMMWAELIPRPRQAVPPAAVLECNRVDLTCIRVREALSVPGPRIVYNPSRP